MKTKPSVARWLKKKRVGATASKSRAPTIPSQIGPIRPFMLILLSLFLVAGVGGITNSFAASGLISLGAPPSATVNTCDITNYLNCYYGYLYNVATACNASATNCQIGGTAGISGIFNPNSPFTVLFTGGIFSFWNHLTSAGPTVSGTFNQGPFDAAGGGAYYTVSCNVHIVNGFKSINLWTIPFGNCDQVNPAGNQNVTEGNVFTMTNWNNGTTQSGVTVTTPFYHIQAGPNGTGFTFGCSLVGGATSLTGFGQTNLTDSLNGYTYYGCDLYKGANPTVAGDPWFSTLLSIPNTAGAGIANGTQRFSAFIQPENWETFFCGLYGQQPSLYQKYASPQCLQVFNNLNRNVISGSNSFNWGWLTPIIGFMAGIVLFVIGLGIRVSAGGSVVGTGTSTTVAVNSQGSRLAQALGIFLIVWSPLYSEFGVWITSGLLNSTGLEGLMIFVAFGSGFLGVWWQMLSYS